MGNVEQGVQTLIGLGIGVFVIVLLVALNYSGYASAHNNLNATYSHITAVPNSIAQSTNAFEWNAIGSTNSIVATFGGSTSWITPSNPATLTITGNSVKVMATNAVGGNAQPGNLITQVFNVAALSGGSNTLTTTTGNFYNISSVTISNDLQNGASPNFFVKVTQTFNAVTIGSAPIANTINSITANQLVVVNLGSAAGAVSNFTSNGQGITNTFGGNLTLAIFALVFVVIIIAVVVAVRKGGISGNGGILK